MKRPFVWVITTFTAALLVLYLLGYRPENIVLAPRMQLTLSLFLVVAAILLFRKRRGAPALLLVIGSAGWFVFWALNAFSKYTFSNEPGTLDGCIFRHWSLCVLEWAGVIATLCFPIGFFWVRASSDPQHLTPMKGVKCGVRVW